MPNAALRIDHPSPEHGLLERLLHNHGNVTVIDPWDIRSYSASYDVAFCVGPVGSCPLAKTKVLFVFGPISAYPALEWDVVVVTSHKAAERAVAAFGPAPRVRIAVPPLLAMEAGRRRLMDKREMPLHASCDHAEIDDAVRMAWWAQPRDGEISFTPLEFNSLCRHGAYGVYEDTDGYDLQVRRHLALGSPVVCPCDRDVIGDLADVCSPDEPKPLKEPVADNVTQQDYEQQLDDALRRVW